MTTMPSLFFLDVNGSSYSADLFPPFSWATESDDLPDSSLWLPSLLGVLRSALLSWAADVSL